MVWVASQYTTLGEPSLGSARYNLFFVVYGLSSWCWVLAALGFGIRYLRRPAPLLARANEAVLPFYVLHQTVLLTIGYVVLGMNIPDLLHWALIAIPSFTLCLGLYEFAIRRVNALRFLFGMKSAPHALDKRVISPKAPPVTR